MKKIVLLENNMIDEHGRVIFEADIPYKVEDGFIENEDCFKIFLEEIWVDFRLIHQN